MSGRVYLVRHAESIHNVSKDFNHPDPALTDLGVTQSRSLAQKFPLPESIGLILTSPLQRTIESALLGFSTILNKRYYEDSSLGIEGGVELILNSDLQESSSLPCDTGSSTTTLRTLFPTLDFNGLKDGWQIKDGFYSSDEIMVKERARVVRLDLARRLSELRGKDLVVVTHGNFMKHLSGDQEIDLPKAGWKTFVVKEVEGEISLLPVE
jgi:broad specificity phosphatase PhoE